MRRQHAHAASKVPSITGATQSASAEPAAAKSVVCVATVPVPIAVALAELKLRLAMMGRSVEPSSVLPICPRGRGFVAPCVLPPNAAVPTLLAWGRRYTAAQTLQHTSCMCTPGITVAALQLVDSALQT